MHKLTKFSVKFVWDENCDVAFKKGPKLIFLFCLIPMNRGYFYLTQMAEIFESRTFSRTRRARKGHLILQQDIKFSWASSLCYKTRLTGDCYM